MNVDEMLRRVAQLTVELPWKSVYVGGATTHLLITDPVAPPVTPTNDVDLVVDVRSPVEFVVQLRNRLMALGAVEDTSENAPLCRWKVGEISLDVMSPDEAVLGFSNHWYHQALEKCTRASVGGLEIRVIDAVTFLATKVEAFNGRGRGDFLRSKDIEDIIAVVDGRPELGDELSVREEEVRRYLSEHFGRWLLLTPFLYAIEGYLQSHAERIDLVLARLKNFLLPPTP